MALEGAGEAEDTEIGADEVEEAVSGTEKLERIMLPGCSQASASR